MALPQLVVKALFQPDTQLLALEVSVVVVGGVDGCEKGGGCGASLQGTGSVEVTLADP